MSRSIIFGRIERSLAGQPEQELPGRLPEFPRLENPVKRFQSELEAVGGVIFDGRDAGRIPELLSEVLRQAGTTEIYWESPLIFEKHHVVCRLRDAKAFETRQLVYSSHRHFAVEFPVVLHSRPYTRTLLESIELSASSAAWGIAETGTVLHRVHAPNGRMLSVLPPAHLVFLSEGDILMNCGELLERVHPARAGSSLTLITGPSQTADIEKTLVRGVHGPKNWFVIITG